MAINLKKFIVNIDRETIIKAEKDKLTIWGNNVEISDEYHSMKELYDHRMHLNIALFNHIHIYRNYPNGPQVIKSKLHNDNTMFEGYFIVMLIYPEVGQISYHYKLEHWDKFKILELEKAPKYDGHTSKDVLERLLVL